MKMKKLLFLFAVLAYSSFAYGQKNMTGSYLEAVQTKYLPGQTVTLDLILYNGSDDFEWTTSVDIQFPAGVTVLGAIDFNLEPPVGGRYLSYDGTTGDGALVQWLDPDAGFGEFYPNEYAYATVDVTIDPGFTGDLNLDYTIYGDVWGATPHEISGTYTLELPPVPIANWPIYVSALLIGGFIVIRYRRQLALG